MNINIYNPYVRRELELCHHGIAGQKWGKKLGPPYPIAASAHSASEKKAGWRKSLDKAKSSISVGKKSSSTKSSGVGKSAFQREKEFEAYKDKMTKERDRQLGSTTSRYEQERVRETYDRKIKESEGRMAEIRKADNAKKTDAAYTDVARREEFHKKINESVNSAFETGVPVDTREVPYERYTSLTVREILDDDKAEEAWDKEFLDVVDPKWSTNKMLIEYEKYLANPIGYVSRRQ